MNTYVFRDRGYRDMITGFTFAILLCDEKIKNLYLDWNQLNYVYFDMLKYVNLKKIYTTFTNLKP